MQPTRSTAHALALGRVRLSERALLAATTLLAIGGAPFAYEFPVDLVTAAIERCSGARGVAEARSRWVYEVTRGDPVLVETLLVDGAWTAQ